MKAATNILMFAVAVLFASISVAQNSLALYVSDSGSAALTEVQGRTSLLVLAGGNDNGQATSGSCVIAASLTAVEGCLLYTSPSPRDLSTSRMPSSA